MNATIIKEWWVASWEMKLIMIAVAIEGLTAGDIAPYITWLPDGIESIITDYWQIIVLIAVGFLRLFKTSTKLTLTKAAADSPAVIAAAKADIALTPDQLKIKALEEQLAKLAGTESPKA